MNYPITSPERWSIRSRAGIRLHIEKTLTLLFCLGMASGLAQEKVGAVAVVGAAGGGGFYTGRGGGGMLVLGGGSSFFTGLSGGVDLIGIGASGGFGGGGAGFADGTLYDGSGGGGGGYSGVAARLTAVLTKCLSAVSIPATARS